MCVETVYIFLLWRHEQVKGGVVISPRNHMGYRGASIKINRKLEAIVECAI